MPLQKTTETREIGSYYIFIEQDQQMALPLGEFNLLAPAVSFTIARLGSGDDQPPAVRLFRHIFRFPEARLNKAARQRWVDDSLQRLLTPLDTPTSRAAEQPDILTPGIYSDGAAPHLYLIETPRPREGYTEVLAFNARSGGDIYRTLINAAQLAPVAELVSQRWQRELNSYAPRGESRYTFEHLAGCLLGGAVGDALGAGLTRRSLGQIRAQFGPVGADDYAPIDGKIATLSWHSQMSLFTAESLIRAKRRADAKGICDVVGVVLHGYYRWLAIQGETPPNPAAAPTQADGFLAGLAALHARRGPSQTVLTALRSGQRGTISQPITQSKGAGAVARIAPVGLARMIESFSLGAEIAALTHGHATGYLAAGCFATLIRTIMDGAALDAALDAAEAELRQAPRHEECLSVLTRARELAAHAPATAESVEQLGHGASAEEALAIAVFCALKADHFAHGVGLAINHSGSSDLTGAMTGQILGALFGKQQIPERWLSPLELRHEIEKLAGDMFLEFSGAPHTLWFAAEREVYPGW